MHTKVRASFQSFLVDYRESEGAELESGHLLRVQESATSVLDELGKFEKGVPVCNTQDQDVGHLQSIKSF